MRSETSEMADISVLGASQHMWHNDAMEDVQMIRTSFSYDDRTSCIIVSFEVCDAKNENAQQQSTRSTWISLCNIRSNNTSKSTCVRVSVGLEFFQKIPHNSCESIKERVCVLWALKSQTMLTNAITQTFYDEQLGRMKSFTRRSQFISVSNRLDNRQISAKFTLSYVLFCLVSSHQIGYFVVVHSLPSPPPTPIETCCGVRLMSFQ